MDSTGVFIPYHYLHNKELSSYDALILAYIADHCDEEFVFKETNDELARKLNTNPVSIPNVVSKLFKLGYINVSHEQQKRLIILTYDAPHKGAESGYVYIMKDTTHSFLKIGFSKSPKYREQTLQGERPTIELVAKYKGTMEDEKTVHRILARYRKRGEWFECPQELIEATIKKVIGVA